MQSVYIHYVLRLVGGDTKCKEVVTSAIHSTLRGLFVVAMTMLQKPFDIDELSVH